ncbi:hypothetical protein GCM10012320_18420 [Sinomonas cellulolyticus]|nr:hypothetical protein GCM10012320_18420 [Sinomonas sp. KCTC 49339]
MVLVHGMWGAPQDWQWVRDRLAARGVEVVVPDLVSHRVPGAGLLDDVEVVKAALRSLGRGPIVVAGWSYGCDVAGISAAGHESVARLVYVSSVPQPVQPHTRDSSLLDGNPAIVWDEEGQFLPRGGWWNEDPGLTAAARAFLDSHPRRPVGRRTLSDPVPAAAWESIPTTVLLGDSDPFNDQQNVALARQRVADVRIVACNHFIPFNLPDLVADVILEGAAGLTASPRNVLHSRTNRQNSRYSGVKFCTTELF